MPQSLKVFLCHGKEDKAKVRDLHRNLVDHGVDPWLDEIELLGGQEWEKEIRKAVRASDVVLVCLSRSSISRAGFVQKEIRFALDVADEQPEGTTYLIPVRLEECEIPERLRRWQWVNLVEPNDIRRLLQALDERWKDIRFATSSDSLDGASATRDPLLDLIRVDRVSLQVGVGLVRLVEPGKTSPLLTRLAGIRRQIASELGVVLPPVRVTDNLALRAEEYSIRLKGGEVSRFELKKGCELAIFPGATNTPIEGDPVCEPAFLIPALWIKQDQTDLAREAGYTVVDHISIIGTHLTSVVRQHACEMFSIQDAQVFLDECGLDNPLSIQALSRLQLPLADLHIILKRLLRELVPIGDSLTIVEALVEALSITRNPFSLTECVRKALRFSLVSRFINSDGSLSAYSLDPTIERALERSIDTRTGTSLLGITTGQQIVSQVAATIGSREKQGVIVTSSAVRFALKQLVDHDLPNVFVLGRDEIPTENRVVTIGIISLPK